MAKEDIQPGDRVQLKSGGPDMTVSKEISGGQWYCQWFEKGELKGSSFPAHVLKNLDR